MLISKLTSQVMKDGFRVKAELRPDMGTYFFSWHVDDGVKLEDAFNWIREAIERIEVARRGEKNA